MEEKSFESGIRRYSEELKIRVCKEHVEDGVGIVDLSRKYKLRSHTVIYDWLRKYGHLPPKYDNDRLKIVEIGLENYNNPMLTTPGEDSLKAQPIDPKIEVGKELPPLEPHSVSATEIENTQLRKELEDAKILLEGYQRMVEIAEEEFQIQIKKKYNTK